MKNHPALQSYLSAVAARDLAALMPLVAPEVTLILPQGQLVTGQAEFETFHQAWFEDRDWVLQADLVRSFLTDHSAIFILNVLYLDKDQAGKPITYPYFLCLTFVRDGTRWSLVLDQNTPIHP